MHWTDEGFLLSKNIFNENSLIIEVFTLNHGKYTGIVYGGSSRKKKTGFQIGNKILLNWTSKNKNRSGYFSSELIKPISPFFFDDKKKTICILSAASILRILLPERQTNEIIYNSLEKMFNDLNSKNWIHFYIMWEILLIKELGFETDLSKSENNSININNKSFKIPQMLLNKTSTTKDHANIKEALTFNRNLLLENFIFPNKLKIPLSRNILEHYYS
jgi:DNA repair protein RecO (recombination protein O)